MDRTIAQSRLSARAPDRVAAAGDLMLAILMIAIVAALAIAVGLIAAMAHGS